MAVQTIRSCDFPEDVKKKACPEGAGEVAERELYFGKKKYKMDLCNDSYAKVVAQITSLLKPAIDQGRVEVFDKTDYKILAAKHWVNLPAHKEKHGYVRGHFGDARMEAFENACSEWEKWQIGDDIPAEWTYDDDTDEVKYVGEAKI